MPYFQKAFGRMIVRTQSAPFTYPPFVSGHIVTTEYRRYALATKMEVYLTPVVHGKIKPRRRLCVLPKPSFFYIAPSARYLIWFLDDEKRRKTIYCIVDTKTGATKKIEPSADLFSHLVSWSPDSTMALFFDSQMEGARGPCCDILHLPTGTITRLCNKAGEQIHAAFWSRDSKQLVYFVAAENSSKPLRFMAAKIVVNNRQVLLAPPRLIPADEVSRRVGAALFPVLRAWKGDKNSARDVDFASYNFQFNRPVLLNGDGSRALLFGKGIHKKSPQWASPDKVIVYGATPEQGHLFVLPRYESTYVVYHWCPNTSWVNYPSMSGWIWVNSVTGQTLCLPFNKKMSSVVDILP